MTGKARMARYRRFIPAIFSVIIISFVGKLWYDNANLTERNSRLREQFILANERNMKFAEGLGPITKRLDSLATTLEEESRRRSTAEARANSLQKEMNFCAAPGNAQLLSTQAQYRRVPKTQAL
jgi:hypothetical protein